VATEAIAFYRIECERAIVKPVPSSGVGYVLAFLGLGWIGLGLVWLFEKARIRPTMEVGKDRIFTLPLRVCNSCRPGLTGTMEVKDALCRVPLYHRLLEKFPRAHVSESST
jgi:hypothetical protein